MTRITADGVDDSDLRTRHVSDTEADAYARGEPVEPWIDAHLKAFCTSDACPCNRRLFDALDRWLQAHEAAGAEVIGCHFRKLGRRFSQRHLCLDDTSDVWVEQGAADMAPYRRHLTRCSFCHEDVADILEMLTPGTYEGLPELRFR